MHNIIPRSAFNSFRDEVRSVIFLNGLVVGALGILHIIPVLVELNNNGNWLAFAVSGCVALIVGGGLMLSSPVTSTSLDLRSALGFTVTGWVVVAGFSAIPLMLSDTALSVTDAIFESVSGITTTGATVLTGLDDVSQGVLIWRAILQWIGGIGIILTAIAVLPALGIGGMQLFITQSSGSREKLLAKASHFAIGILGIYSLLTVACAISYNAAGMSRFDSWAHAMTTIASGGLSTHDQSAGYFDSLTIYWLMILFMMLACLPYGVYLMALRDSPNRLWKDDQIRGFVKIWAILALVLWVVRLVTVDRSLLTDNARFTSIDSLWRHLTETVFSVTSIITTTGYSVTDHSAWGGVAVTAFFFIGFLGGCAGSGTCALKTFRVQILVKAWWRQILLMQRPNAVISLQYNGQQVEHSTLNDIFQYICLFLITIGVGAVILAAIGLDPITALSGSAAAVTNVGPGLGETIGPAGTYSGIPSTAKWVITVLMLLGRLELVTVLIFLTPHFWRR